MCGIVGYTGTKSAAPILLDGLAKLEYRGYDSAGIAVMQGDALQGQIACLFHAMSGNRGRGLTAPKPRGNVLRKHAAK